MKFNKLFEELNDTPDDYAIVIKTPNSCYSNGNFGYRNSHLFHSIVDLLRYRELRNLNFSKISKSAYCVEYFGM